MPTVHHHHMQTLETNSGTNPNLSHRYTPHHHHTTDIHTPPYFILHLARSHPNAMRALFPVRTFPLRTLSTWCDAMSAMWPTRRVPMHFDPLSNPSSRTDGHPSLSQSSEDSDDAFLHPSWSIALIAGE
ncbi:hypothetical protein CC2G_010923 [Coprinopsis cinerea AmutBmut pab1-1]|nr:hypothetical protein CC2G_010923 [Coprinopsis cinerea AmutBmut pab1-1]